MIWIYGKFYYLIDMEIDFVILFFYLGYKVQFSYPIKILPECEYRKLYSYELDNILWFRTTDGNNFKTASSPAIAAPSQGK